MKTRICPKYFVDNCGRSHIDMDDSRPVTSSSREILADCGWFRVAMVSQDLKNLNVVNIEAS